MTVQQYRSTRSTARNVFEEGLTGWKGYFFGKVLWAVIMPPTVAVVAHIYVHTNGTSWYISKALAYALTPLAVLIGFVGFVFATEKARDGQSKMSVSHVILWWISLWALAATIATLAHIASGPWTRSRPILEIAALLTAGAFATFPALPTLKELIGMPAPPAHRGARLSVRIARTCIAGSIVGIIWWRFYVEWDSSKFDAYRYIGSATFYVVSAGLVILALEIALSSRNFRESPKNRTISIRTSDGLNWRPCRCQIFTRSCVLAASIAVPAGLAFNAVVDPDAYKGFSHLSLYIFLGAIATGGFVLIAPLAHRSGQALHDFAARTVVVSDKWLQERFPGERDDEATAADSDVLTDPKAENQPDVENEAKKWGPRW